MSGMNSVVVGIGSNIDPVENTFKIQGMLKQRYNVVAQSSFKRTSPIGPVLQDDFLNGCVLMTTDLSINELKQELKDMEILMGRSETSDKWGPRTMDLDILIWNGEVIDHDVYERDFLWACCLEVCPELKR